MNLFREILMGLACVALYVLIFCFPWGSMGGKQAAKRSACLSNVKQQSLGLIVYSTDYDRFPPGRAWMDSTARYRRGESAQKDWTVHCPEVPKNRFGYAFNAALSGAKLPKRPELVPLTYESSNLRRNAVDPVTSLPRPGRHDGKSNLAYADGHARSVKP